MKLYFSEFRDGGIIRQVLEGGSACSETQAEASTTNWFWTSCLTYQSLEFPPLQKLAGANFLEVGGRSDVSYIKCLGHLLHKCEFLFPPRTLPTPKFPTTESVRCLPFQLNSWSEHLKRGLSRVLLSDADNFFDVYQSFSFVRWVDFIYL